MRQTLFRLAVLAVTTAGIAFCVAAPSRHTIATTPAEVESIAATGAAAQLAPADGTRIAFTLAFPETETGALYTINPDGSAPNLVQANAAFPDWSPDGRQLAFVRVDSGCEEGFAGCQVWTSNADGSNPRHVITDALWPSWSPEGQRIAFAGPGGIGIHDLLLGATTQVVASLPGILWDPEWSPVTDRIAFFADIDDQGYRVWTVTLAGTLSPITDGPTDFGSAWSPDGTEIAFFRHPNANDVPAIVAVTVATGAIRTLVPAHAMPGDPDADAFNPLEISLSWSPDGQYIVFPARTAEDVGHLFVARTDGSGAVSQITSGGGVRITPAWQPLPRTIINSVEFTQGIQELQTVDQLKEDLEVNGSPPVPIIAGKPAVMRVYFEKAGSFDTYQVEVDGEIVAEDELLLDPRCEPEDRRRNEDGCRSLDFYFTPPSGTWDVTLTVSRLGEEVEEHEFTITSVETRPLVIRSVKVCDSPDIEDPNTWLCADPARMQDFGFLLRPLMPTDDLQIIVENARIPLDRLLYANGQNWWLDLLDTLKSLYLPEDAAAPAHVFYFGVVRHQVDSNYWGLSFLGGPVGGGRDEATFNGGPHAHRVAAHELGHMLGRQHTNTHLPGEGPDGWGCYTLAPDAGTDWVYPDNLLRVNFPPEPPEVGFDVEGGAVRRGDQFFEMMGYCAPTWVSPHTYTKMLETLSAVQPAAAPRALVAGDFWTVAGSLEPGIDFQPLYQVPTTGPDDAGSGSHTVEVRDGTETALFMRHFEPSAPEPMLPPDESAGPVIPTFRELLPVQPGAAAIVVLDDQDQELGRITLEGEAPQVTVESVTVDNGLVAVDWSITDADSSQHWSWLQYSTDGVTWTNLAPRLTGTALTLSVDELPGSETAQFRVYATDGVNTGVATSEPFVLPKSLPEVRITAPTQDFFRVGQVVALDASAYDADDGALSGAAVQWSSSLQGALGQGAYLPAYGMAPGTHTITVTVTDSDGNSASDAVVVTVSDYPVLEGLHRWGDHDCSGEVDAADIVTALVALTRSGEPELCYATGTVIPTGATHNAWGDLDCSGAIDLVDVLQLGRFVAGLPVDPAPNCLAANDPLWLDPPILLE